MICTYVQLNQQRLEKVLKIFPYLGRDLFHPLVTCVLHWRLKSHRSFLFNLSALVVNIPWISEFQMTLKSVFVYEALRVSALYASFAGLICFSPSPRSPIKKPSKNSSLFRFKFSDKFSKGLKPSSVKLGYFLKGMNINQDWYWAFFSSISSFFAALFFCFLDITGRSIPKCESCQILGNNVKTIDLPSKKASFLETKI